jgi:hypothetical protein
VRCFIIAMTQRTGAAAGGFPRTALASAVEHTIRSELDLLHFAAAAAAAGRCQ